MSETPPPIIFPEEPEWEDPKPIRKVLFSELVVQ